MHELSLVLSILDIVEEEIVKQTGLPPDGGVKSVTVRVGRLSSVEPEALAFAWEVARQQSPFPEAALEIEDVPVSALCEGCGEGFELQGWEGCCPRCGGRSFRIIGGREMEISRITWQAEEIPSR